MPIWKIVFQVGCRPCRFAKPFPNKEQGHADLENHFLICKAAMPVRKSVSQSAQAEC
jgi:hypothetical protein